MLRILSAKKLREFYEQHLNQNFTVLFEQENKNGFIHGFTENYMKISHPFDEALIHKSMAISTKSLNEEGFVSAELVSVTV